MNPSHGFSADPPPPTLAFPRALQSGNFTPLLIKNRLSPSFDAEGAGMYRYVLIVGKLRCDDGKFINVEVQLHAKRLYVAPAGTRTDGAARSQQRPCASFRDAAGRRSCGRRSIC